MKLAIMQPYFFPYLGYFQLLNYVDEFILLDDVNYITRGWIERNIIIVNKMPYKFSLPLKGKGRNSIINELELHESFKMWRERFLKTIRESYNKCDEYSKAYLLVEEILFYEGQNLFELLENSLNLILKYLDIKCSLSRASFYQISGKGQDRILELSQKKEAKIYINPIGGKQLYDSSIFKQKEIELKFHKIDESYFELNKINPYISIIDYLMKYSPDQIRNSLLSKFEIIS